MVDSLHQHDEKQSSKSEGITSNIVLVFPSCSLENMYTIFKYQIVTINLIR